MRCLAGLLPWLTGGFLLGAVLADWGVLSLRSAGAVAILATAAGLVAGRPRWRAVCATAVFLAAGGMTLGARLEESSRAAATRRSEGIVEATVCSIEGGQRWLAAELCDAEAVEGGPLTTGDVLLPSRLWWSTGWDRPEAAWLSRRLPGDRIRVRLRVRPLVCARNPGERARCRGLERRGVGGRASISDPSVRARLPERDRASPGRLIALATRAPRRLIADRLATAGHGGALLAALAVGDRSLLQRSEREAFYALGVGHLLAVSGLHLALAAGLAYGLARAVLRRLEPLCAVRDTRRLALAVALSCACGYALLAGWGLPVRRAVVLLVALAAALATRRVFSASHALAGAALLIAVAQPWAIFEPGAQLSFAASAALMLALRAERVEPDSNRVNGVTRVRWRALPMALHGVLWTSATAFLATAPIAVTHGGGASPVALAANALLVPLTGLILLPLALASAALASLPWEPVVDAGLRVAAGVAGPILSSIVWLAERGPEAGPVARPAGWALALAFALAATALCSRSLRARAVLAIALALWLRWAPSVAIEPAPPRVVALDVGQGDAVLVQGERAVALVDGGWAAPGLGDLGASTVVPALRALGVSSLDLVVASHGDTDHQGGLPAVLRAFPVARLWLPPGGVPDPVFAELVELASRRGVRIEERAQGDSEERIGDLRITPLWPPRDWRGSTNDRSLVLRIELAQRRLLLTGDLGGEAERALRESGADLRADVLKVGHHGSASSASPEFLRATGASVALVSAPCGRRSLPSPQTLARLRSAGQSVWWTGRDGALLVGLTSPMTVWGFAERPDGACAP